MKQESSGNLCESTNYDDRTFTGMPYVNDFEKCLNKCTSSMYADDTSVTCSAEDIDKLCNDLRTEVDNIAEQLRQNKLSLNTDKTEYMVVGHKRQINRIHGPLEVNINGGPIKRAKKVKYLGVTLEFKEHTTAVKIGAGV